MPQRGEETLDLRANAALLNIKCPRFTHARQLCMQPCPLLQGAINLAYTCSTSKELVRDGRPGDTFPLLAEGLQVRHPAGTSGAHIDNPIMCCISWMLTLP